jgi:hypothetical protein
MPDYSNLAMVKDGVISLDPVITSLYGLTVEQLGDESVMSQFDFVAFGMRWFPIVDSSVPLQRYQSYDGGAALSFDADARIVRSVRQVITWDAAQILAYKQSITRHISKQALRARFTQAEKIAFEMAQIDDPNATRDVRVAAASVRVLEKDMNAGAFVDLNGPNTQALIRGLQALGVIAAGRADEIIWGDIAPDEVP